ncbi:MAG: M24 family metallopeptidase C-terminal domain-containing protein, partial [Alphaproteobacteria bacterium]
HGVGSIIRVHEGPQRISKRGGDVALEPGMIISNEPGYNKTGAYGIRIENLVVVVESGDGAGGKPFYGFDTVTCAPIDTRLVDATMLTVDEKNWLNSYHAWVEDALAEHLNEAQRAWLAGRCAAL